MAGGMLGAVKAVDRACVGGVDQGAARQLRKKAVDLAADRARVAIATETGVLARDHAHRLALVDAQHERTLRRVLAAAQYRLDARVEEAAVLVELADPLGQRGRRSIAFPLELELLFELGRVEATIALEQQTEMRAGVDLNLQALATGGATAPVLDASLVKSRAAKGRLELAVCSLDCLAIGALAEAH